jgi:hypothetical protein
VHQLDQFCLLPTNKNMHDPEDGSTGVRKKFARDLTGRQCHVGKDIFDSFT